MNQISKRQALYGLALALPLLIPRPVMAIPAIGNLDSAFNPGGSTPGTVATPVGSGNDDAQDVALQTDGKILVAGTADNDFALVRYNANGTLDTTFNGTGIVATDFASFSDRAVGVVVQSDGKVVVAGTASNGSDNDFALARYNVDGSLDTDFGTDGKVMTDFGSTSDRAGDIALQADGKLVVSGYRDVVGISEFEYVLARYNPDGSPDAGFGTDGKVTTALGTSNDWTVYLTLQPDGKIVIASAYSSGGADFFIARYTADGVLDTTFNPGGSLSPGVVTTDFGSDSETATAALVQLDGKIVAAGFSGSSSSRVIALVRYNTDGSLDTTFGTNGKTTYDLGSSNPVARAAALQPDGRIVTAGVSGSVPDTDFTVVRFTEDGSELDVGIDSIGSANDSAYAVALQPGGKLIAAGTSNNGSDNDFAVARYVLSDAPWNLTPDTFSFTDESGVAAGSQQTSDTVTVAGLDAGASVPVTVNGGEYAKNGSTIYTTDPGWVQNGDTLNVRHTAASGGGETTDTTLSVGGIMPGDNLAQLLGTAIADAFSSTTSSGGSSGLLGPWSLAVLAAGGWFRWRRRRLKEAG